MNAREAQVLAELQAHAAEIEVLYGVAGVRGIAEVTALIARLQAENALLKDLMGKSI